MTGFFDTAFCLNRTCKHYNSNPPCGRSMKNLEGRQVLVDVGSFAPDKQGNCKHYMEPTDWVSQIEPWMEPLAKEIAAKYDTEKARRKELKDANSLDADDLDKEV